MGRTSTTTAAAATTASAHSTVQQCLICDESASTSWIKTEGPEFITPDTVNPNVHTLSKLLQLSSPCTNSLLTDLLHEPVFCDECQTTIKDVADLFEQVRKLETQIICTRSKVETRIQLSFEEHVTNSGRGQHSCKEAVSPTRSRGRSKKSQCSTVERVRELIVSDLRENASPDREKNQRRKAGVRRSRTQSNGPSTKNRKRTATQNLISESPKRPRRKTRGQGQVDLENLESSEVILGDLGNENDDANDPVFDPGEMDYQASSESDAEPDPPAVPNAKLKGCKIEIRRVDGDKKGKRIRPNARSGRLPRPRRKRSGSPRPKKVKIQKPKGPFACSECPSIFQKEQSLQYHYNKNHGMTQFATYCSTCGKRFYSQRSLETHLEVQGGSCRKEQIPDLVTVPLEHGTMNFKCNLCGLGSRNRRIMQTHTAKHTGVKNFICQICGEGLKTQQSLKQHMLSQHPDSDPSVPHPFACTHPGCGKTMGNPQQFRFHMKKHLNEYDFQCEHCDYKTTYPSCFKTHVDSVHKKLRPYQCRHCAQTFKKSTQMQKHIYSKHTAPEDRPFKCATCGKTFSDKFNLGRHEIIHTGLKPIVCKLCGKRFAVDDYLRIHMKTHKQKYSSKKILVPESGGQSLVSESGSPEETVEEEPEIIVDLNAQPISHVVVFAQKTCP